MASFFEPESYLFDPSHLDDDYPSNSSSFISFSSFADLTKVSTSPFDIIASWDVPLMEKTPSTTSSTTSETEQPFAIIDSAFELSTPKADVFCTDSPYRSSGSSSSSSTFESPTTPSRASIDYSVASRSSVYSSATSSRQNFGSWDPDQEGHYEFGPSSSGSSSYAPPINQVAHRATSNPSLGSAPRTRPQLKHVASMPSLKEEDGATSQWFDGTEQFSFDSQSLNMDNNAVSQYIQPDDLLIEDLEWAFGEYGLGNMNEQLSNDSNNLYSLYTEDDSLPPSTASSNQQSSTWISEPLNETQDVSQDQMTPFDHSNVATFTTIDPMLMANSTYEEEPRPSTAPGLQVMSESYQSFSSGMLSVPLAAGMMTRSASSDCVLPQRQAPPRELFSYAPQQLYSGPPVPQPLYTSEPSQSYYHYPRAIPSPSTSRRLSGHGLSVQIQQPHFSTYQQCPLPPTPQSATFGDFSSSMQQPVPMTRAGTQPLPTTRKLSASEPSGSMPAHLVRAQAIVQMQEAKEEAQRQELKRQAANRRVGMANASVLQPQQPQQQQQQQQQGRPQQGSSRPAITGWEGPSAQTALLPVLTTTPLVTIHPPPQHNDYHYQSQSRSYTAPHPTTHRVHPPPYPEAKPFSRPVARLPSTPSRVRKVTGSANSSPAKRSPASKKKAQAGAGFSWGEATFINFTPEDAEKLLTGVAPSGSQSKRKREEDAPRLSTDGLEIIEMDRSKRSRSGECL